MVEQTIQKGYKQTELGTIPEDWDIIRIGDHFDFKNGLNKGKEFFGYGTPIVNYMDVYKHPGLRLDDIKGRVSVSNDEMLAHRVKKGDVFFTRTSETVDEIGMSAVILENVENTVFSGFLLRARPKTDYFDLQFKKYCFLTTIVRKQIMSTSSETTRALTNGRLLSQVLVPVPKNRKEQSAIASVLSNIDELIETLEKLIEKKKNIKQGAMQELLTGKKRLPEFRDKSEIKRFENLTEKDAISENWEVVQLKDITSQIIVPMRDKPKFFRGTIPWCRIEDFEGKYLSNSKSGRYVDKEIVNNMNLKIFPADTLLVSCSADLGRCAIVKKPLVTNQTFIGLVIDDSKADNEFLYYYMTFHAEELNNLSSGTTISYLSREQFENLDVRVPRSKIEQSAIAQVLSDMDIEIEKLEQKKEKYKQLETGLKQQLLTGRIRLQWKS